MNHLYSWFVCLIVSNNPCTIIPAMKNKASYKANMNSNESKFPKLQPLTLWTVHSEPQDDPSLSCYMQSNNTWFCTDDYILHSLVDNNDSY